MSLSDLSILVPGLRNLRSRTDQLPLYRSPDREESVLSIPIRDFHHGLLGIGMTCGL